MATLFVAHSCEKYGKICQMPSHDVTWGILHKNEQKLLTSAKMWIQ